VGIVNDVFVLKDTLKVDRKCCVLVDWEVLVVIMLEMFMKYL